MTRYIGVDLHRHRFTVCNLAANGMSYLSQCWLDQLPQFVRKLRPTDQVAVEASGNTRLSYDAVVGHPGDRRAGPFLARRKEETSAL